jgi:hypothetical protein
MGKPTRKLAIAAALILGGAAGCFLAGTDGCSLEETTYVFPLVDGGEVDAGAIESVDGGNFTQEQCQSLCPAETNRKYLSCQRVEIDGGRGFQCVSQKYLGCEG